MPATVLWFDTEEFVDSQAERDERINENIGGAALAKWLASSLRGVGMEVVDPWAEDHGWDFNVAEAVANYTIVCTIEDETGDPRSACVQVHKAGSFWRRQPPLGSDDPVLQKIVSLLEGRGAAIKAE